MAPSTRAADPLDTTAWVLGLHGWEPGGRVVVLGGGAGELSSGLRRAGAVATVLLTEPGQPGLGRAARGRPGAWPLRGGCIDVVVVAPTGGPGADLATVGPELARALAPGGVALVVLEGPTHHRELDELVASAGAPRPRRPPAPSVEEATTALGARFVVDEVASWTEAAWLSEPRRLLGAVQALRPELVGRLSGFTNWTTVMARVAAAADAATAQPGGMQITVDLTLLRYRSAPA